ncbi:P-loop containing nucleoside triphosphate hydrolase protein [Flagelloscypha sp. PMI_526]|nr:P-loop containing nucleoside triphosphate hydrolase protein [Flagelloscypha sp. PMI_526]
MFKLCRSTLGHTSPGTSSIFSSPFFQASRWRTGRSTNVKRKWEDPRKSSPHPPSKPDLSPGQRYRETPRARFAPQHREHKVDSWFLVDTKLSPVEFITRYARHWAELPAVLQHFVSFGFPEHDVRTLLSEFSKFAYFGRFTDSTAYSEFQLWRLEDRTPFSDIDSKLYPSDIALHNIFVTWVTHPSQEPRLSRRVEPSSITRLRQLLDATKRMIDPIANFPRARMKKRRFILHVGPTNSGKTHHALRALAASRSGCYAGPLRLLAHEVFERLNLGQICPLGMDPSAPPRPVSRPSFNDDEGAQPQRVTRMGNPDWVRACNMITGEEHKYVMDASLQSCTVEMVSLNTSFDVLVVDEIQMLNSSQRGFAWANVVLGSLANEIHLCGEDAAEPLVRAMLALTGDDLEVRRYQRLSPLIPAEKSLNNNWENIEKGDAVVCFSRTDIFAVKAKIEKHTGMRVAIVYGKLPPEIRSEQALLYNDPDSGYDVLVGSDAMGMGLNLKIRRIVFYKLEKPSGANHSRDLATSQIKQIAGRAGRFGQQLNPGEQAGGYVTTFSEKDLPALHEALQKPNTPVTHVRIWPHNDVVDSLASVFGSKASLATIFNVVTYMSLYNSKIFAPPEVSRLELIVSYIEPKQEDQPGDELAVATNSLDAYLPSVNSLTVTDRLHWAAAPINWIDPTTALLVEQVFTQFQTDIVVDLASILDKTTQLKDFDVVREAMYSGNSEAIPHEKVDVHLRQLESIHRALTSYIWLAYRNPVTFNELQLAITLKTEIEKGLKFLLELLVRHSLRLDPNFKVPESLPSEIEVIGGNGSKPLIGKQKTLGVLELAEDAEQYMQPQYQERENSGKKWFTDMGQEDWFEGYKLPFRKNLERVVPPSKKTQNQWSRNKKRDNR